MKSKAQKQLESVRKDLKAFFGLLESSENQAIYSLAYLHGVKLSDAYAKKAHPIADRLKKFATGEKI